MYLIHASFVGEGVKDLLKEGGSKRQETVKKTTVGMGEAYINSFWVLVEKNHTFVGRVYGFSF